MLKKSLLVIFLVLFIDQAFKIWVKTHMYLGEEIYVLGSWFRIHFVENPGMAFGMEFSGGYGKLFLSLFRIVAVCVIGWYLFSRSKREKMTLGLMISLSFIFAGAVGNIIDSAFYGLIFSSSPYDSFSPLAQIFPAGGGYDSLLYGKVVDMLYFPLFTIHFPSWFPVWGNKSFDFFEPVFNISDASITTGVLLLIVFQKRYFRKPEEKKNTEELIGNEDSAKPEVSFPEKEE